MSHTRMSSAMTHFFRWRSFTPHLPVVANTEMMAEYSQYSHQEQIYYATISAMDEQVGRLWKKLEELGQAENTMIWFCSDNGPENGTLGTSGPFRERKRSLYEGGIRIPAFCVWPKGIQAGLVSEMPMVTSDYQPTVNDVLNIDYPSGRPIYGVSLKGLIKGKQTKREKPIGFQFGGKMSWVTQEYKLISTDKGKIFELDNLWDDSSEKQNIIAGNSDLASKMKSDLLAWVKSCKQSEKGADY